MTGKSPITTHVLDTTKGKPAKGIVVRLERGSGEKWAVISEKTTDGDGRIGDLVSDQKSIHPGTYRMTFETGSYFKASGVKAFYPHVAVTFEIEDASGQYHIPLLLSPFGYSTYRGS